MNPTIHNPGGTGRRTAHEKGLSHRVVIVLAALIVLGIIFGLLAFRRPVTPLFTDPAAESNQSASEALLVERRPVAEYEHQSTGIEKSAVPSRNTVSAIAPQVAPAGPLPDSARPTQRILSGLMEANPGQAPLSPERAASMNAKMQEIAAEGSAAVPAIREFLDRTLDLTFTEAPGGNTLNYNSLRSGLFEALRQIGDPEAVAVSRHVLQTTADLGEIAQIARNLESLAPGEHRQEILEAAREALALAAKGQSGDRDAAPLFQMLQAIGDASVVPVLDETAPQFSYYSTLALAGLPEGDGVPSLIEMAESHNRPRSNLNDFALLMLAQVSSEYPEAQKALIEQAHRNKISDSVWPLIGNSLVGEQLQIGQVPPDAFSQGLGGLKNFRNVNNQNFSSVAVGQTWSDDQINQRVALIDQLLGVNNNPAAIQSLQHARATLTAARPTGQGP